MTSSMTKLLGLGWPSYEEVHTAQPDQALSWGWNSEGQLGIVGASTGANACRDEPGAVQRGFIAKAAAMGLSHTLLLSNKGQVYAVGKGKYGRLGLGSDVNARYLAPVANGARVHRVAAGSFHSAIVTERNNLLTFGRGEFGQLGHTTLGDESVPRQLMFDPASQRVDLVACGSDHTIFSLINGCVYGMGGNKFGQVNGMLDAEIISTPALIDLNPLLTSVMHVRASDITSLSCGTSFSVAIKAGEVYTWGTNTVGQCGQTSCDTPIKAPQRVKVIVPSSAPKPVFISVSSGIEHSMALTGEGWLYGWGSSKQGQMGQGLTPLLALDTSTPIRIGESLLVERVVQMSCGAYHTVALTSDGSVYTWGLNDFGQCGPESRGAIVSTPHRLRMTAAIDGSPNMTVVAGGRSSLTLRFYPTAIKVRDSTYRSEIQAMYSKNLCTDCEIIVNDRSDGLEKTVLAHKIFLSRSKSALFAEQLDSSTIDVSERFDNLGDLNNFVGSLYNEDSTNSELSLAAHLFLYVNNPMFSDVKICVQHGGENQTFYAHKCILVNRSAKLKIQLESFFQEGINNTIYIEDVPPRVYLCYLHYLYTDKLHIDEENAVPLLYLAHEESLDRMLDFIQEYLTNAIDDENVSNIYEICSRLEVKLLGDQCLYYIAKNIQTVSKTESFGNLPDDLKHKLTLNSVNVPNDGKKKDKNCTVQ
eukprot:gene3455-3929_t